MSPNTLLLLSSVLSPSAHAAGASVASLGEGDLIITELMANPASVRSAQGEWIELYNTTNSPINLMGLVVTARGTITVDQPVTVGANDYVVLAVNSNSATNGGIATVDYTYSYSSMELVNRNGTVTISNGTETLDAVSYLISTGFPAPWGATINLDRDYLNGVDNDNGYRWCGGTTTYGIGDEGTPGAANDDCPTPLIDLEAGDLVVSEVMASPNGVQDRYGEWFEIKNTSGERIDLYGLTISSGSEAYSVSTHSYIDAGDLVLFVASTAASLNGGVTGADFAFGRNIVLTTDDSLQLSYQDTVFDTVSWDEETYPLFTGASLNLDVNSIDATSNDSSAYWCTPSTEYGGADNYGTPGAANDVCLTDNDGDGVSSATDCDDNDPLVNPFVVEVCDSVDNNCDGNIDEGTTSTFYADADNDGYGLDGTELEACTQPSGYAAVAGDCDDVDGAISPGAEEVCDDIDNDCDSDVDEFVRPLFYLDADGDGFGDESVSGNYCSAPSGYVAVGSDCDDNDAGRFPGNEEICDDIDNDCDTQVDEFVKPAYFVDSDGDGYGDPATGESSCTPIEGRVLDRADCDDSDAATNPGAAEQCDAVDNDCDEDIDEGVVDAFYADADGDGFGNPFAGVDGCEPGPGHVDNRGDCNDADSAISPDAEEACDEIDNNCDGNVDEGVMETFYADADADGFGNPFETELGCSPSEGYTADDADCDDADPTTSPLGTEVCDEADNDCNGSIDDGLPTQTWYRDEDSDGLGDPGASIEACAQPSGYVAEAGDCNDMDGSVTEVSEEICDGIDNDCDGEIDEDVLVPWYADTDGDGHGDPATVAFGCEQPSGYIDDGTDCDDLDETVNPLADEICDELDNDCDGAVDEDLSETWYADADGDGFGVGEAIETCLEMSGYANDDGDCDDEDSEINPAAEELCDGIDNDCDGQSDTDAEASTFTLTFSGDLDLKYVSIQTGEVETHSGPYDDIGDTHNAVAGSPIDGRLFIHNQTEKTVYEIDPEAGTSAPVFTHDVERVCGMGLTDEQNLFALSRHDNALYYFDLADGSTTRIGDLGVEVNHCGLVYSNRNQALYGVTIDGNANSWVLRIDPETGEARKLTQLSTGIDWDTAGITYDEIEDRIYVVSAPGIFEVDMRPSLSGGDNVTLITDEIDNDNLSFFATTRSASRYYTDEDGDGYGDPSSYVDSCEWQEGMATNAADCDDADELINPDADDICDDIDNDCDGLIDEDAAFDTWYEDADGDGYGDPETAFEACDEPGGCCQNADDPDDSNPVIGGGGEICDGLDNDGDGEADEGLTFTTWYRDADGDGHGDPADSIEACDTVDGYVAADTDCDDNDENIHPDQTDICDFADNDCDLEIDEDQPPTTWYEDTDGDGYGNPEAEIVSCEAPDEAVDNAEDPDDTSTEVTPEVCDGIDNDGDGQLDNGFETTTWYRDADADGHGDPNDSVEACAQPEGYIAADTDCDDTDELINPDAAEVCDSLDNDCDTEVDEGIATSTWHVDADGDGYGDPNETIEACAMPAGYTEDSTDCDDGFAEVYPGAEEVCDGLDNDCDLEVDEGLSSWYYADVDADGYGDAADATEACDAPDGYVEDDSDCDDSLSSVNPGMEEACDDLDNDCDDEIDEGATQLWFADLDRDSHGDASFSADSCEPVSIFDTETDDDCDDRDAEIHPGAEEVCDGLDNDCDTEVDEGLTSTWYEDDDGDGYGDASDALEACEQPEGYTETDDDCDDRDAAVNPGAAEVCDNLDNNCDGTADEGVTTDWYADADGDGHGNPDTVVSTCEAPDGYVDNGDDCNDCNNAAWEEGSEECDSIPDDCDCEGEEDDTGWEDTGWEDTGWVDEEPEGDLQSVAFCSGETVTVLDDSGAPVGPAVGVDFIHPAWTAEIEGATWIWSHTEPQDPRNDETARLFQAIDLPADADIVAAELQIAADNTYAAQLNGGADMVSPNNQTFRAAVSYDLTGALVAGENDLLVAVTNEGGGGGNPQSNPAGALYCVFVDYYGEEIVVEEEVEEEEEELPGVLYYADQDNDGYGDPEFAVESPLPLPGFVENDEDCDDDDDTVYLAAEEICDGKDNDCDGDIDEGFELEVYYEDIDGDGYGDPEAPIEACALPEDGADNPSDPDDTDVDITPEVCDGIDNDGDGQTDEALLTLDFEEGSFQSDILILNGDAELDSEDGTLSLVPAERNQAGSAMVAFPMPGDAWKVSFQMFMGNGTGADGLGLIMVDPRETELLGSAGGGLGVRGLNGYSVEFDTYRNGSWGDPNENHVALIANRDFYHLEINDDIAEMEDAGWIAVDITVDGGMLTVEMDGEEVLSAEVPEDMPEEVMLGIAAATGAKTNDHLIDDLSIGCASEVPVEEEEEEEKEEPCDTEVFYRDADGDGRGDAMAPIEACEQPAGTVENDDDCDDSNADVHTEDTWHADADADGHGDAATSVLSCGAPAGHVSDASDCDDSTAAVYPGAEESCDGLDNNCDGETDEGLESWYYADVDADGYGDAADATEACDAPDGYVSDDSDCDDSLSSVNPGMEEVCDELDNNCDDSIDEGVTFVAWLDRDSDEHGDEGLPADVCALAEGLSDRDDDCDDADAAVNPSAEEVCDETDNDCDGDIDEDVTTTFYADADADGHGDAERSTEACDAPDGHTDDATDCDDHNVDAYPGAPELCNDEDDDCDGTADNDLPDTDGSSVADCKEAVVVVSRKGVQMGNLNSCEGDSSLNRELDEIADALDEMGMGMVTILEDTKDGVPYDAIAPYPVVIYHNLGWANQGDVETAQTIAQAAEDGKGVVLMGDDIAYHANKFGDKVREESLRALIALEAYRGNGRRGAGTERADTTHPVIDGVWGEVNDFPYIADIDRAITMDRGEEHLMYIEDSAYPAVWAEEYGEQRTVTMAVGLYTSHDCPLSDEEGIEDLRALFQNAVWWVNRR